MTDLYIGPAPLVNFEALDKELRAALPGKIAGIAWDKRANLTVIVVDGVDAEALRPDVAAVIAAHDPSVKTPAQQQTAARAAAAEAVKSADLTALAGEVMAAKTLEDVRPLLLTALDLLGKLALVNGLAQPSAIAAVDAVAAPAERVT